ncbi:MAG: DNA-binding protein [Acidilobaceae archaeon]|nr:DNA-binding protein [Acidilobaceae archaeon]
MREDYVDEELEAIRSKKLAELQKRLEEERRKKEAESQREALLMSILTSEARSRLTNIGLVKPEIARAIEDYIIQLVSAGRLKPPVGEEVVKRLLAELDEKTRKDYKITFRRK